MTGVDSMRARLCSILVAALLSACAAPQIYHQQLQVLDKGMSEAEVVGKLKLAPNAVFRQQADGRQFELYRYLMNNGVELNPYLVAFENGKLVYWGYVDEFRRQPDAGLSKAAGAVADAVLAPRR
jgi:hypothetical protein